MSVVKFELTKEHIGLLKYVVFERESLSSEQLKTPQGVTPWGGFDY